jgi:diacylglycerol kinase
LATEPVESPPEEERRSEVPRATPDRPPRRRMGRAYSAAREVVDDARSVRGEVPSWAKNPTPFAALVRVTEGFLFWNTIEHNKIVRVLPYHLAIVAIYLLATIPRGLFHWFELGILLFASFLWFALEVVNTTFEYLIDELHGRDFDERYGHIKDMGSAASGLVAVGQVALIVFFAV